MKKETIERLTNFIVWERELERYVEYSLEDLRVLAEETYPNEYNTVFPDNKLVFSNYKFEIDREWDGSEMTMIFAINVNASVFGNEKGCFGKGTGYFLTPCSGTESMVATTVVTQTGGSPALFDLIELSCIPGGQMALITSISSIYEKQRFFKFT